MDNTGITTSSYLKEIEEQYRRDGLPYQACFELTPLCNFDCKMCYVQLKPYQIGEAMLLTAEQWIALGQQSADIGLVELIITGGEPLVRSDFKEIYESLYKMGFLITLRTNGYLMNDDIISWLENKKPYETQITLYGANDETYEKICGVAHGYSTVLENLKRLKDAGFRVKTTMTVVKDNENEYEEVKRIVEQMDIPFQGYFGLFAPFSNTGRDISEKRSKTNETLDDTGFSDSVDNPDYDRRDEDSAFNCCSKYKIQYTINWEGKMTPCTGIKYLYTEPLLDGVEETFRQLNEKIEAFRWPDKCTVCRYKSFCISCPSVYSVVDGETVLTDDDCCKRAKYRYMKYQEHVKTDQEKNEIKK